MSCKPNQFSDKRVVWKYKMLLRWKSFSAICYKFSKIYFFRLILISLITIFTIHKVQGVTCRFHHVSIVSGYTCVLIDQVVENGNDLLVVDGEHVPGFRNEHVTTVVALNSRVSIFPSLLFNHFPIVATSDFVSSNMTSFVRPIPNCAAMRSINLNGNRITLIPGGIFQGCAGTIQLLIRQNAVESVAVNAFTGLFSLRYLDLSGNLIARIHGGTSQSLSQLGDLWLNLNSFTSLEVNTFVGLPRLNHLTLSHNQLRYLNASSFAPLQQLRILNVAHNRIESIEREIFNETPNLQLIHLVGNICADDDYDLWIIDGNRIIPNLSRCFGSAGIKKVNLLIILILVLVPFANYLK